jgi:hypothetical protein
LLVERLDTDHRNDWFSGLWGKGKRREPLSQKEMFSITHSHCLIWISI